MWEKKLDATFIDWEAEGLTLVHISCPHLSAKISYLGGN